MATVSDGMPIPAGKTVVAYIAKCASHRARERFLRFLTRRPAHRGWGKAKGGSYYVTEAEMLALREAGIPGISVPRCGYFVHPGLLEDQN